MTELSHVEIATDGACKGNPGPGGWGVLIRMGEREKELSGGEKLTHQQPHGVAGCDRGAGISLTRPCRVTLSTDSRYVMDGLTQVDPRLAQNGWRTADKKPVKNQPTSGRRYSTPPAPHRVEWKWVKGHAGHPDNERADQLARDGIVAVRAGIRGALSGSD